MKRLVWMLLAALLLTGCSAQRSFIPEESTEAPTEPVEAAEEEESAPAAEDAQ